MDGMGWMGLSYTAVTPRASLQSDANNHQVLKKYDQIIETNIGKVFSTNPSKQKYTLIAVFLELPSKEDAQSTVC